VFTGLLRSSTHLKVVLDGPVDSILSLFVSAVS
jgi:hypothetical protein